MGRDRNGVKIRADGKGDAWARAHRNMGQCFNMHDVDGLIGIHAFAQNTGERLFIEYVPDHYKNRHSCIRKFAMVAMFDRKKTLNLAMIRDSNNKLDNTLGTAFYLWLCRTCASNQPIPPRFFFVGGGDEPPWGMQELNIYTAEKIGNIIPIEDATGKGWRAIWDAIGLVTLRNEMKKWTERR